MRTREDPIAALMSAREKFTIVDLSQPLEERMPVWPTLSKYYHTLWLSMEWGDNATAYQILMNEHTGTHVDAPGHFVPPGHPQHRWIDETSLDQWMGPAAVLDCRDVSQRDRVMPDRIRAWEDQHSPLTEADIVIFNFGWWKKWKLRPGDAEFLKDWPGFAEQSVDLLIERHVKAVGVDTPSPDAYASAGDPVHHKLLSHGIGIIENLANLDVLPPRCYLVSLPLRIRGGTGSPVRALALVPHEAQSTREESQS